MTLLDAVSAEFARLTKGDDGGFMSKVSNIVSPPKPKAPKKDKPAASKAKGEASEQEPAGEDMNNLSGAAQVRIEKADTPVSNAANAMAQALAKAFGKKK